jgi:hypothetical protein
MAKGNEFDPYRDALVVETKTIWSNDFDLDRAARRRLEQKLHADPQHAALLDYERMHTGFCRIITVTPGDLERVK